jgi:putative ABC transport system ATP-binding protein
MPTSTPLAEPRPVPGLSPSLPPPPLAPVVLDGVGKRYGRRRSGVQALSDISVSFPRGTLTAVMGISGSGKSTLLQCAAGLDRPTTGTVHLAGSDTSRLSRRKLSLLRRRHVGFVFQALNLIPTLSVAENIALPLRLDHRRVRAAHIGQLADRVGLGDKLKRMPGTLSGGQQQRVAIARALDLGTAEGVLRLLRDAVDELGKTVVVVTHDPSVTRYADCAIFLDQGTVARAAQAPQPAEMAAILRELAR